MSLARFILDNKERVLVEWEGFARSLSCASAMNKEALRDDAGGLLETISREMQTAQSTREQVSKSQGKQAESAGSLESAALEHGLQRFMLGFDINDMVAEFRALRASVVSLWLADSGETREHGLYELTRFHEGMDKAVQQSVQSFSERLDRSRELFMGILSHDLRTPLHVILNSSVRLMKTERNLEPQRQQLLATHIQQSARVIQGMVNDLLDVASTRLGGTLPLHLEAMDAAIVCNEVIQQFQVLHPKRTIGYRGSGDLRGEWDPHRLHQLLTNLVRNSIQHGAADTPISLTASNEEECVRFVVHNEGEPIPPLQMPHIFEPLSRGTFGEGPREAGSLGLGLYIASTIVQGHRGTLTVTSSLAEGTDFTAKLPRRGQPTLTHSSDLPSKGR